MFTEPCTLDLWFNERIREDTEDTYPPYAQNYNNICQNQMPRSCERSVHSCLQDKSTVCLTCGKEERDGQRKHGEGLWGMKG